MTLDRPVGYEESRPDLLVRLARGDEHGDPLLGRRQGTRRRRAAADPLEFGARPLGPQRRADPLEGGESFLERRARLATSLCASLRRSEGQKRAAPVEWKVDLSMELEGLVEHGKRSVEIAFLGG